LLLLCLCLTLSDATATQLTTKRVSEELASNETLLYIQQLEAETEKLKKQVRDVAAQLHTCKVC